MLHWKVKIASLAALACVAFAAFGGFIDGGYW
jgi:hypothetical protein